MADQEPGDRDTKGNKDQQKRGSGKGRGRRRKRRRGKLVDQNGNEISESTQGSEPKEERTPERDPAEEEAEEEDGEEEDEEDSPLAIHSIDSQEVSVGSMCEPSENEVGGAGAEGESAVLKWNSSQSLRSGERGGESEGKREGVGGEDGEVHQRLPAHHEKSKCDPKYFYSLWANHGGGSLSPDEMAIHGTNSVLRPSSESHLCLKLSRKRLSPTSFGGKNVLLRKFPIHPDSLLVYIFGRMTLFNPSPARPHSKVQFAPEVVQQADEKGDVAGKERNVPRAEKKKKKTFKKVVDNDGKIIYNPNELDIELDSEADSYNCEDCECCTQLCEMRVRKKYPDSLPTNVPISLNYKVQVENFMESLDTTGNYLDGNLKTISGAADLFRMPVYIPMAEDVNHLAAKLWLATFALRFLFTSTVLPTQLEFQQVIRNLQELGKACEKACEELTALNSYFSDFESKYLYLVLKMASRMKIKVNSEALHPVGGHPVHMRMVLELSCAGVGDGRKKKGLGRTAGKGGRAEKGRRCGCAARKTWTEKELEHYDILINVADVDWNEQGKWEDFSTYAFHFRYKLILGLIDDVYKAVQVIQSQLRFLTEDIAAGKFDQEDKHFLNVLTLMDNILKFFIRSPETTAVHERNLRSVIRNFSKDSLEFMRKVHFTFWKTLELRDTLHLCYAFMEQEFGKIHGLSWSAYKPTNVFKLAKSNQFSCGACHRLKWNPIRFAHMDFYRAPFLRILQMYYVSNSNRCQFILRLSQDRHLPIGYEFASAEAEDDDETTDLIRTVFSSQIRRGSSETSETTETASASGRGSL